MANDTIVAVRLRPSAEFRDGLLAAIPSPRAYAFSFVGAP